MIDRKDIKSIFQDLIFRAGNELCEMSDTFAIEQRVDLKVNGLSTGDFFFFKKKNRSYEGGYR